MKPLKIKFVDFWSDDLNSIFLYDTLKQNFNIEISEEPDVLIYSVFGKEHLNYNCKKVFFTSENVIPDYRFCDYSIGFNYDDGNERHLRYPLYLFYNDVNKLVKTSDFRSEDLDAKTDFCVFVVSNDKPQERKDFFKILDNVKRVDAAGSVLNNMKDGWTIPRGVKHEFLSKYRFNLAFENCASEGYTTEKIFQPMVANSVPIYWGDPLIGKDFNTKSFVHIKSTAEYANAIDYIMELENNKEKYLEVLNEPYLRNNSVPNHLKIDVLLDFFNRIFFDDNIKPVSQGSSFVLNKLKAKSDTIGEKVKYKLKKLF